MKRQVVLFLVAGGIAAAANFGSRVLLSQVLTYVPAIIIAYIIGMITAFLLNRAFVFKNPVNSVGTQAAWFIVINLFAVAQTVLISLLLTHWLSVWLTSREIAETIAHAVGVVFPVFTSFAGHKYLSFRAK